MTPTTRRRVPTRILVAVVGALAWLLLGATAASAHAGLTNAEPAQASRVETAPASVLLRFSEPVAISNRSLQVLAENGRRVDLGAPAHPDGDGRALSVRLDPGLPRGTYTVVWRVVSADSHPVAGTYSFGLGVQPGAVRAADTSSSPDVVVVHGVARAVSLAAAAGLVGTLFFCLVLWPAGVGSPRAARIVRWSWWAGAGSTAALFLAQGPYGAGLSLAYLVDPDLLSATLSSRYGQLLLLRLVVLAIAVPVLRRAAEGDSAAHAPLAGLGALYLLTFSLSAHSGQGRLVVLATVADALHAAAASVWLGGLAVLLLVVLRPDGARGGEPRADLATLLPRWSRAATAAVGVLVVTGVFQAWREIGDTDALTGTRYGWLVLVKAGLLAAMLVVAASARSLTGRIANPPTIAPSGGTAPSGGPSGGVAVSTRPGTTVAPAGRLRTRVVVEAVLGVVVLVATSLLVNTVPARDSYDTPYSATLQAIGVEGDRMTVLVDIDSTRRGLTAMHLYSYTSYGDAQPFVDAQATFVEKAQGLGPVKVDLPALTPGHGYSDALLVPSAGTWTVTLRVLTDDTHAFTATTTYQVRG